MTRLDRLIRAAQRIEAAAALALVAFLGLALIHPVSAGLAAIATGELPWPN